MSTLEAVRVLLLDPHTISRVGLRVVLDAEPDFTVVDEISALDAVVPAVDRVQPHVVVAHAHAAPVSTLEEVQRLAWRPGPRRSGVVILVDDPDDSVPRWRNAGAYGVISSQASSGQIVAAVRMVAAGYRLFTGAPDGRGGTRREDLALYGVTRRERDVLQLIARGFSNAEISDALTLSESTVKSHVQHLFDKLDLRNRVHAVIFAYEIGMVQAGHAEQDDLVGSPL